jgi:hypothetical protein
MLEVEQFEHALAVHNQNKCDKYDNADDNDNDIHNLFQGQEIL